MANTFGIRDNHMRGKVADFLVEKINAGSHLSVVSAYFTIYAYEALSAELESIGHLNFLFGEPRFISSLDPDKTDKKSFKIEDEGLELANRLQQKEIARRCPTQADPIRAAQALIEKMPPSTDDLHAALGFLRAALFRSLISFCSRKHVGVAFKEQAVDVQALWQAVLAGQATLFLPPHDTAPGQLDAERRWLVSSVTEADLASITLSDLNRLIALLTPGGGTSIVLDSL